MEIIRTEIKTKRPYVKPVAIAVHLTPEEAVLGNCKQGGGNGPSGTDCTSAGLDCATMGS
jgi:hypothetical protein